MTCYAGPGPPRPWRRPPLVAGTPGPRGAPAKLVVWKPAALAPQVDKIMQEQCYAYAKQVGLKEHEVQYSTWDWTTAAEVGRGARGGEPARMSPSKAMPGRALYRSPGHLLEVTDLVDTCSRRAGARADLPPKCHVSREGLWGPAPGDPWPLITRLDLLEAAKVDPPKTWEEFIGSACCRSRPELTGYGMCLGGHTTIPIVT